MAGRTNPTVIDRCPNCGEGAPIIRMTDGELKCMACGASGGLLSSRPVLKTIDEGHYQLIVTDQGIQIDVDRLRREKQQLVGELAVRFSWPGALTFDGILSIGDLNLSSVTARTSRAKYLSSRGKAQIDWDGLLEQLSHYALGEERKGHPAINLREVEKKPASEIVDVLGLPLLTRHPMILFGDGGTAKSYLALFIAGHLAKRGARIGLFDWELSKEDHRDRLERLFGADMPNVYYVRCNRPLFYEVDRLRRVARDQDLDYAIFDSVAFACDGRPEDAEVAGRYFQAVRQIGQLGSLHVAHISKAEGGDMKPFGSTFWHNGARSTWYVQLAQGQPGDRDIVVRLHHRKTNLGPRMAPLEVTLRFDQSRTHVRSGWKAVVTQ